MAASIASVAAQELKENVNIEGHYAPKVIKTDKIYTLPQRISFTLESPSLDYDYNSLTTPFANDVLTMPATSWQAERNIANRKGYVDFHLGSWLNANLSAGYRFIDNEKTTFGIALQHNSTTLQKPYQQSDVKRLRYDDALTLYTSNQFSRYGTLNAALTYHLGYFNYFMLFAEQSPKSSKKASQTLNDIKAKIGWNNFCQNNKTLSYNADLKLRSFNYRSLYLPQYLLNTQPQNNTTLPYPETTTPYSRYHPDRENHLALCGQLSSAKNENQLNLKAAFNLLTYSRCKVCTSQLASHLTGTLPQDARDKIITPPADYGLISLTPAWKLLKNNLNITLGAQVDFAINAPGNKADNHYSLFHIAPDVKIAWGNQQFGVALQAIGGSKLNTMASAYDNVYYSLPLCIANEPSYTPLDAILDLNFGPYSGFEATISGEYKIEHHIPSSALYPAILAYQAPLSSIYSSPGMADLASCGLPSQQYNLHGSQLAVKLQYSPIHLLSASASAKWTPQSETTGYYNGYDRPTVVATANLNIYPLKSLSLSAEYMLRHNRAIYTAIPRSPQYISRLPLEDISLLNFAAQYQINNHITLSLNAYNLLNRHTDLMPALPATGIEFAGGVQWLF